MPTIWSRPRTEEFRNLKECPASTHESLVRRSTSLGNAASHAIGAKSAFADRYLQTVARIYQPAKLFVQAVRPRASDFGKSTGSEQQRSVQATAEQAISGIPSLAISRTTV